MTDLASLAAALAKAGAPVIGAVIGGPAGAAVAGTVVDALAESLGVAPTPDAVTQAVEADPVAAGPVIAQVERDQAPQVAIIMATMAADLARAEAASESFYKSGWRPAGAWLCIGLTAWQFVAVPLAKATFAPNYPPIPWDQLVWIITTYLGLYMGGHAAQNIAGSIADAIGSARPARNVVVQPNATGAVAVAQK